MADLANDHDGWNPGADAIDQMAADTSPQARETQRQADAVLRDRIVAHLFEDRILNATGIDVAVENGIVTLSGRVVHASDVRLAEMLTQEVAPQAEVRNTLIAP